MENGEILTEKIYYFNGYYDYYNDPEKGNYWIKMIDENPENLLFWFDFLDADGSEISKYAVNNIGDRLFFQRYWPKVDYSSHPNRCIIKNHIFW